MKIKNYYSLDECTQQEEVFQILNELQDAEKIDYEYIDDQMYGGVIKISNIGLTANDQKKLIEKFNNLDVIDFPEYGYDPHEEDEEEWEEDDFNDEWSDEDEY